MRAFAPERHRTSRGGFGKAEPHPSGWAYVCREDSHAGRPCPCPASGCARIRSAPYAVAPSVVPAATPPPFTLSGTGFGPVPGAVGVTFTAASGTPFAVGTSATATVPGTVSSPTTITGTTPVATTGTDVSASVDVLF